MKWIKTILLVIFISFLSQAQSGFELRFVNQAGLSLGVQDNQYTRIDFKKGKHNIGWSNTVFPSLLKKQFVDLSYMYELDLDLIKLFPSVHYSSNIRTDDLQISTAYFVLAGFLEYGKFGIVLSPGYDQNNEFNMAATLLMGIGTELKLFVDYGQHQRFTITDESFSFGLTRYGKRLNIKSGIQFPKQNGNFNARILTSFSYRL